MNCVYGWEGGMGFGEWGVDLKVAGVSGLYMVGRLFDILILSLRIACFPAPYSPVPTLRLTYTLIPV